jgi:hypothetical protein
MASIGYSSIETIIFELHYSEKTAILNFYDMHKIGICNTKLMSYAMSMQIFKFDRYTNLRFPT